MKYESKEPDFKMFEQSIDKRDIYGFLGKEHGLEQKVDMLKSSASVVLEKMDIERNKTFNDTASIIAIELNLEIDDILNYMKYKNLTFHECGDRKTVRIIPTEINQAYGHTGGIGLQKDVEAIKQVIFDEYGDNGYILNKEKMEGKVEGRELDIAIENQRRKFRSKK